MTCKAAGTSEPESEDFVSPKSSGKELSVLLSNYNGSCQRSGVISQRQSEEVNRDYFCLPATVGFEPRHGSVAVTGLLQHDTTNLNTLITKRSAE